MASVVSSSHDPSPSASLPSPSNFMFVNRFDRLYEEAGRSSDSCDNLLKRLERSRHLYIISFLVLLLFALAVCVWAFIRLMRWFESPTLSVPPSLDRVIYPLVVPFCIGLAFDFALILHTDVCIKMLLFMRGHQTRPTATNDNSHGS
jgi:predicted nucleic acid-binding Zn ribbon protein